MFLTGCEQTLKAISFLQLCDGGDSGLSVLSQQLWDKRRLDFEDVADVGVELSKRHIYGALEQSRLNMAHHRQVLNVIVSVDTEKLA
ncbi:MAG: hypothetical protein M3H12_07520 [Chromatiales bacterium]